MSNRGGKMVTNRSRLIFLVLIGALFFFVYMNTASATLTNVYECTNLSTSGTTYQMNTSISATDADCITINATNVTLDCQGFRLTFGGTGGGHSGVALAENATTTIIQHCNFSQSSTNANNYAIRFTNYPHNSTIYNNTFFIKNSSYGISLTDASINNVSLNNFYLLGDSATAIKLSNSNESYVSFGTMMLTGASNYGFNVANSQSANVSSYNISSDKNSATGIYFSGTTNTSQIVNCSFFMSGNSSKAIQTSSPESMNISCNNISMTGTTSTDGIHMTTGRAINISGNIITLTGTSSYGVYLNAITYSFAFKNDINMTAADSYGIYATSTNYSLIYDNWINNSGANTIGLLHSHSKRSNFTANFITTYGDLGHAVYVNNLQYILMDYNNITTRGNYSDGIYIVNSADNNNISANWINTTRGYAIMVTGTSRTHYNQTMLPRNTEIGIEPAANTQDARPIYYIFGDDTEFIENDSVGEIFIAYSNNTMINNCTFSDGLWIVHSQNISVNQSGFSVGYGDGYGIFAEYSNATKVANTWFAISGNDSYGFYAYGPSNATNISNSTFVMTNKNQIGIYLRNKVDYAVMEMNTILMDNNKSYGILIEGDSVRNNVTNHNHILTVSNHSVGVYIYNTSYNKVGSTNNITTTEGDSYGVSLNADADLNEVSQNRFTSTGVAAYSVYVLGGSDKNNIKLNVFNSTGRDNDTVGIYVASSSDNNVTDNVMINISGEGIYLSSTTRTKVNSNVIYNATNAGIRDVGGTNTNITDNNISHTVGTNITAGIVISEGATGVWVYNNTLSDNDVGEICSGIYVDAANVTLKNNTIDTFVDTTCPAPIGISILASTDYTGILLENNKINLTTGGSAYGLYLASDKAERAYTIGSVGHNLIQGIGTCIYSEDGEFILANVSINDCDVDAKAGYGIINMSTGTNVNSSLHLINISVAGVGNKLNDSSTVNASLGCNVSVEEYVIGNVTLANSGAAISGATVVIHNGDRGVDEWTATTLAGGHTLAKGTTTYFDNATSNWSYYNMTITASKTGFTTKTNTSQLNKTTTMGVAISATGAASTSTAGFGGGYPTFVTTITIVTDAKFAEGYTKAMSEGQALRFESSGNNHHVSLKKVYADRVTITVSSDPFDITLLTGEYGKFDLNGDNFYDVYVKLNSISTDLKASITIQELYEEIPAAEKEATVFTQEGDVKETLSTGTPDVAALGADLTDTQIALIVAAILVVVGILAYSYYKKNYVKSSRRRY